MSAVLDFSRRQPAGRPIRLGELGVPRIPGQRCRVRIRGLVMSAEFVGRPGRQQLCWVVRPTEERAHSAGVPAPVGS